MKHRFGMFLFAIVFFSAAGPVLADKIPANFKEGDGASIPVQCLLNKNASQDTSAWCHFGLNAFKEDAFRIESNPAVLSSDLGEDGKISDLDGLRDSMQGPNNRKGSLFDIDSKNGDSFGRDDEKAWWQRREKDWDNGNGSSSVVATPEPGSLTLLLFGLAGLGIITYQRRSRFSRIEDLREGRSL